MNEEEIQEEIKDACEFLIDSEMEKLEEQGLLADNVEKDYVKKSE